MGFTRKHFVQMTNKELDDCKARVTSAYSKIRFSMHAKERNKERGINISLSDLRDGLLRGSVVCAGKNDQGYIIVMKFRYNDKYVYVVMGDYGLVLTLWWHELDDFQNVDLRNYDVNMFINFEDKD